ncbi:beta-lactamase family protein [Tessaracoccus sp. OS52]|uniref:serine hydrolase domain-containing protein n=1 Tax=Tessaracoccus sp. OS52 TaxID=2886691 RepID=UPI001D1129B8|nr:serine hydrolase domain-containing protein [Tessaracoccus sp. OS52]MCC2592403.1 beta-lactamase family protein [Tessaracoccus sp. OS52]
MPAPQVLVRTPQWEFRHGALAVPHHAASVGKVMTAALIVAMIDEGRFGFDTPVGHLLPANEFDGLPAAPGVAFGNDVTIDHLLSHTSGLPDYFDPPGGVPGSSSAGSLLKNPDRRWTPTDLLEQVRGRPAEGFPGESFAYGDTGYVVLGRIAEEQTGTAFNRLLQDRIFEPLGMEHTSTPYTDATSPEDLAEVDVAPFWLGGVEASRALAASVDWAGGGIVTTAEDLVRFQEALHGGRLVKPASLARMSAPRNRFRAGIHYGTGMVTLRFHEFLPPLVRTAVRHLPQPVGGLGYFGTHMYFYPEQRVHVVLNFNSHERMGASFSTHFQFARLIAKHARKKLAPTP